MRELLKEARDFIDEVDPNIKGQEIEKHYLLQRIDAALAEPELDAVEILRKMTYETLIGQLVVRDPAEAAALIADYGKRVTRAMLEEIFDNGYQSGDEFGAYDDIDSKRKNFDAIAAKYGYRAE